MRLIDADHLNELLKKISKKYDEEGDLDACVVISEVLGIIHLDCPTINISNTPTYRLQQRHYHSDD